MSLLASFLVGGAALAAELNSLKSLNVASTPSGAQVVVEGNRVPTFTVFRLSEPDRLVVDVSSADASSIQGHHEGQGPINGVVASQFSDDKKSVGRVMVALASASQYDVKADGTRLVVSVTRGSGAEAKAGESKVEPSQVVSAAAAPSQGGSDVVKSERDERAVAHPANRITAIHLSSAALSVRTDGEVAKYELIELQSPPRLALDIYGVRLSAKSKVAGKGAVQQVRAASHGDKVRIVVDMNDAMPAYQLAREPKGLSIALSSPSAPAQVAEAEIDGKKVALNEAAPLKVEPPAAKEASKVDVLDVQFEESESGGRLELALKGHPTFAVERPNEKSAVLTLQKSQISKRLERSLDTSALGTPIKMISTFSVPNSELVRIAISSEQPFEEAVRPSTKGLSWTLSAKGSPEAEEVKSSVKVASVATEVPEMLGKTVHSKIQYEGKRVSFEFKDIDIHNLLRVIAEVSKKNVVVSDDVSGKVTIRLRNVPWDQALELILRSKGLGKEEFGNIIRVAPLKALEEEAKLREGRALAMLNQEPVAIQLVPVNYANAKDLSDRVKEVLSPRGKVTVDERTNVMVIHDVQSNISRARSLVQNLDTQTPQVLIESRIVEANTTFTREIGVQWGGLAQAAPGTGNPTGLVFPNTVSVRGASTSQGAVGVMNEPNFAVNLPAAVGTGSGGALGLVFGSVGGAVGLNLRLSALENQGSVKTISAPKVTTVDNKTARISQGVSIPFSQFSAQGVNTTFVEARLSLEVTPHITQDGSVMMAIKAENNQPDPGNTGANGQPAIQRKEAATQVLVKDGDTTVIGGIYVRRGSTSMAGVPFLSKIPVLGFFFRSDRDQEARQELLIFITPRIINRQQAIGQNL
jgi:type IV pilus assembly protein PilQ